MSLIPRVEPGFLLDGRYRFERPLGAGGWAVVWKARDLERAVDCTVKLLRSEAIEKPSALARFVRETELVRALDHPRIARAYDARVEAEACYLVMEYVAGPTLHDAMSEGRFDRGIASVRACFLALTDAVGYAHRQRVVHRDLKPRNIILEADGGAPKVLDFGVARLLDVGASDATTQGRMVGTPLYFAPEQFLGVDVDERADVFALGCLLFELFTGLHAWARDDEGGHLRFGGVAASGVNGLLNLEERIREAPRPDVCRFRADLPGALGPVIERALAADRARRFASAAALGAALEAALDEGAAPSEVEPTVPGFDAAGTEGDTDAGSAEPTATRPGFEPSGGPEPTATNPALSGPPATDDFTGGETETEIGFGGAGTTATESDRRPAPRPTIWAPVTVLGAALIVGVFAWMASSRSDPAPVLIEAPPAPAASPAPTASPTASSEASSGGAAARVEPPSPAPPPSSPPSRAARRPRPPPPSAPKEVPKVPAPAAATPAPSPPAPKAASDLEIEALITEAATGQDGAAFDRARDALLGAARGLPPRRRRAVERLATTSAALRDATGLRSAASLVKDTR